jgi:hypothetical protein
LANWKREEPVDEAKPFKISKREVWEALLPIDSKFAALQARVDAILPNAKCTFRFMRERDDELPNPLAAEMPARGDSRLRSG